MARCKYCERKGIFLKLGKNGLCDWCEDHIRKIIQKRCEFIKDSENSIEKFIGLDIVIELTDEIIDYLKEIKRYEELINISTFNQSIDEVIENKFKMANKILIAKSTYELQSSREMALVAESEKEKVKAITDLILNPAIEVRNSLNKYGNKYSECQSAIDSLIVELKESIL